MRKVALVYGWPPTRTTDVIVRQSARIYIIYISEFIGSPPHDYPAVLCFKMLLMAIHPNKSLG